MLQFATTLLSLIYRKTPNKIFVNFHRSLKVSNHQIVNERFAKKKYYEGSALTIQQKGKMNIVNYFQDLFDRFWKWQPAENSWIQRFLDFLIACRIPGSKDAEKGIHVMRR